MTTRRLAAILVADVVGYSRLVSADEAGALARLGALRRDIVETNITRHSGRLFKVMGDGFLVEFASAVQAVTCAISIQAEAEKAASALDENKRMRLRIGIHVGDVMVEGDDLMGDGVNIAARLESIAAPGGISVSRAVHDQVRDRVEVAFDDKGEIALKNIARPVQVFSVAGSRDAAARLSAEAAPALALPDKPSIAALPFQNMSGDPEQEYFADGMVEDIITALSRKKQLFVIARNSSFTYKGKAVDIKQVGRELGVRYVLEGSVRKAGNRVRITGQLIDAATGAHLWADKFDGDLENIFDLQDQITSSVVGAIAPHLDRAEIERTKRKPTGNLQAYDYYLRGLARNLEFTREGSDVAYPLFQKAIELDPDFALAHAATAQWFTQRKAWAWSIDFAADALKAAAFAKRALQLSNDDAMVFAYSGSALAFCVDDIETGVAHFEEAIRLDPNLATAWLWGGWARSVLGEHEAAMKYFQRALRLSPLDPRIYNAQNGLAYACFFLDRYDEASNWAAVALRAQPDFIAALRIGFASHALAGRVEEARKLFAHAKTIAPTDRISETRKRMAYRRDQDVAKLEKAYRIAGMPE